MSVGVLEKTIELAILVYLAELGPQCFAYKQDGQGTVIDKDGKTIMVKSGGFRPRGKSDILCIYRGHVLAIEVKTPERRDNVSIYQKGYRDRVKSAGGKWTVATSVDDVKKTIKIIDYQENMFYNLAQLR